MLDAVKSKSKRGRIANTAVLMYDMEDGKMW